MNASARHGRGPVPDLGRRILQAAPSLLLLACAVALWQLLTVTRHIPDYLLPGPVEIWRTALSERDLLLTNAVPTLLTALGGLALALAVGVALAVAIRYSRLLRLALYPVIIASQTVPTYALAPILAILFGFNVLPRLIIVFLICFFVIVVDTVDGFESVDPDLVNLMRTLGAGPIQIFRQVEMPTALPFLFTGAKITYSVVGALFGEWAGSSEGLGYLMQQKSAQFDVAAVFAALALLTLIGISLFAAVSVLERLCVPWYRRDPRRHSLSAQPR
jgi:ABC-type nitrate/sulfonate/bicarbonate transport system permease component